MFRKNYIVKINLPGGIVATGDLYTIIEAAERARVPDMQFGVRQQLFCRVQDRYGPAFLRSLESAGIFYETEKERFPNIISSYVTEGVFSKSAWVSEGLYKDILDGFDHRPGVKINLVESSQSFVPYFTGHLNFISSGLNNHWHLVVRRPGTNELYRWGRVVYSTEISRMSRLLEEELCSGGNGSRTEAAFGGDPAAPELRLPTFRLPYYEGFNRYGNKYWLGIYRREELFPLSFLKDLCLVCRKTKIGQIYTTPWKSILIKGIEESDLPLWEYVLGKYRMNIRHASNELNWQIDDHSTDGLRLKRYLVRQLDQDDIRTEGLSFAVKLQKGSGLPGSIVIRKQAEIRPGQQKLLDRYELWHTADFDPHSRELILFRKDLEKETLFPYIVSLCKDFYSLQSKRSTVVSEDNLRYQGNEGSIDREVIWECKDCLTQYQPVYGDPGSGVAAGTAFEALGKDYICPVCGSLKEEFRVVEKGRELPVLIPGQS
ncbi:MAG TPA: rubredoxin [Puia sp.]|nr:rubredoxin [Puia sp.]